ncbi:hypothetical protein ABNC55_20890 [Paenibacillus larvae]
MVFHFIALEGVGDRRIAWHYASEGKLDKETLKAFMAKTKGMTGGIHKIQTDSTSWQSVVDRDSYFADVLVTRDADEFIRKNRLLSRLRYLREWVKDMSRFTGFYIQRDLAEAKREIREIEKELQYTKGGR